MSIKILYRYKSIINKKVNERTDEKESVGTYEFGAEGRAQTALRQRVPVDVAEEGVRADAACAAAHAEPPQRGLRHEACSNTTQCNQPTTTGPDPDIDFVLQL